MADQEVIGYITVTPSPEMRSAMLNAAGLPDLAASAGTALLAGLTARETDRLWWRIVRAMTAVQDEIDALALCPAHVRDSLYGAGCLDSYRAILDDLISLADDDIPRTITSWASMLDDTPEEGNPQWHDSEGPTPIRHQTWTSLAARMSLARAWRLLSQPR